MRSTATSKAAAAAASARAAGVGLSRQQGVSRAAQRRTAAASASSLHSPSPCRRSRLCLERGEGGGMASGAVRCQEARRVLLCAAGSQAPAGGHPAPPMQACLWPGGSSALEAALPSANSQRPRTGTGRSSPSSSSAPSQVSLRADAGCTAGAAAGAGAAAVAATAAAAAAAAGDSAAPLTAAAAAAACSQGASREAGPATAAAAWAPVGCGGMLVAVSGCHACPLPCTSAVPSEDPGAMSSVDDCDRSRDTAGSVTGSHAAAGAPAAAAATGVPPAAASRLDRKACAAAAASPVDALGALSAGSVWAQVACAACGEGSAAGAGCTAAAAAAAAAASAASAASACCSSALAAAAVCLARSTNSGCTARGDRASEGQTDSRRDGPWLWRASGGQRRGGERRTGQRPYAARRPVVSGGNSAARHAGRGTAEASGSPAGRRCRPGTRRCRRRGAAGTVAGRGRPLCSRRPRRRQQCVGQQAAGGALRDDLPWPKQWRGACSAPNRGALEYGQSGSGAASPALPAPGAQLAGGGVGAVHPEGVPQGVAQPQPEQPGVGGLAGAGVGGGRRMRCIWFGWQGGGRLRHNDKQRKPAPRACAGPVLPPRPNAARCRPHPPTLCCTSAGRSLNELLLTTSSCSSLQHMSEG